MSDLTLALNVAGKLIDKKNKRIEELEEAYTQLWSAIEDGTISEEFFYHREDFRSLIQ